MNIAAVISSSCDRIDENDENSSGGDTPLVCRISAFLALRVTLGSVPARNGAGLTDRFREAGGRLSDRDAPLSLMGCG
jgi:hypothetical protein